MELMGVERRLTVAGGLPLPIATPAHRTAHDIAGKGIANPRAFQAAVALAVRMASARRSTRRWTSPTVGRGGAPTAHS